MFALDKRLEEASSLVAEVAGCQLRLMHDQRYFWLLVIPMVDGIEEWHDLDTFTHDKVSKLVRHCAAGLKRASGARKMNVAAIGNIVATLHIHIVARNPGDPAWPGPIWGVGEPEAMTRTERDWRMAVARDLAASFRDELF